MLRTRWIRLAIMAKTKGPHTFWRGDDDDDDDDDEWYQQL